MQEASDLSRAASAGSANSGRKWKRVIVWSLLVFALINLILWRVEDYQSKKSSNTDVYRGTGSIDLAVNEFKALPNKPTVVLLGSSLVMFPFWSMDMARHPAQMVDMFHHHGSEALEESMRAGGFKDPHVFSFAIFGQMVSDAYIYVSEFLRDEKKPEYLIYGIAPRDFSDSDLSSPMTTNTFKRLVNLDNFAQYANLYLPGFQERLDFILGRVCYFYGHRARLQQEVNKGIEKAYIFTHIHPPEPKTNFASAGFMLFGGLKERWKSSEMEYQRRYKDIAERDLSVQMGFLKRLVDVSRERKIKLIVVNMPLTEVNRNILPAGFYQKFRNDVATVCAQPGVKVVDIGDSKDFKDADFWDTAHLGPTGGMKILPKVLPALQEMRSSN